MKNNYTFEDFDENKIKNIFELKGIMQELTDDEITQEYYKELLDKKNDSILHYTTPFGIIEINPNERKKVCTENALDENEEIMLNKSDLYPAQLLENVDVKIEDGIMKITDKKQKDDE